MLRYVIRLPGYKDAFDGVDAGKRLEGLWDCLQLSKAGVTELNKRPTVRSLEQGRLLIHTAVTAVMAKYLDL